MMRVSDSDSTIYDGLRALDWTRYLRAMWIICGELRVLYQDRLSEREHSLMDETLGLVRQVAMTGVVTGVRSQQAVRLRTQWETLMSQREGTVKAGQWNTWVAFGELCGEIAGSYDRYASCEMLYIAATDRWREKVRPDGRPIPMTGDEEVADDSPMAQMLRRLSRVVSEVGNSNDTDPAEIRAGILG
jgi:hypothetical protein